MERELAGAARAPSEGATGRSRLAGPIAACLSFIWPGAGHARVQAAVGTLTGVQLDGMVVAELQGFVRAVDALGGLDIGIPEAVYDARYPDPDGGGTVELFIPAGLQHLDGWHALAYARTRHQDGDYWRMERQQRVLVALQRQLRCDLLSRVTDLLAVARDSLWVSLPLSDLPDLIELASRVEPSRVARLTLTPPDYPEYLDAAAIDRIRAAVRDILASPGPAKGGSGDEADCDPIVDPRSGWISTSMVHI